MKSNAIFTVISLLKIHINNTIYIQLYITIVIVTISQNNYIEIIKSDSE